MALLNKLFAGRRRDSIQNINEKNLFQGSSWIPPAFSKEQIRLLLFRECEGRNRKLTFDSLSIKKVEPVSVQSNNGLVQRLRSCPTIKNETDKTDEGVEITQDGTVYQFLRPKADTKMLGEMVFGSVAMSYRGTTSKIHTIRTPPQLMITKVYPSPQPKTDSERKYVDSLPNSLADCIYVHESDHLERLSSSAGADLATSLECSDWKARSCHEYGKRPSSDEDRQLRSAGSLNNLLENKPTDKCPSTPALSSTLSHSGSYHSLQRRWMRYRATSMEFGIQRKADDLAEDLTCTRRTKLGMAIVISLDAQHSPQFQTFFFSHVTLIEGYLNKLRISTEKAYTNKKMFLKIMFDAYKDLKNFLFDLYTAPRLPNPVWLSMMSPHQQHHVICLRFMTEFMNLLNQFDIKSSKFFVSTLLTAVLTHHLAWVPTVMPPGINPNHSYHTKHSATWVRTFAKSNPYNPLWVQLGDLYGAIGNPCKMARTVVLGKKSELVKRFLYVLSYFIRCSEVYENTNYKLPEEEKRNIVSVSEPSLSNREETGDGDDDKSRGFHLETIPSDTVLGSDRESERVATPLTRSSSCDLCARTVPTSTSPSGNEMSSVLRPGRHFCDSCRELSRRAGGAVRTGRIFEPKDPSEVRASDKDAGIDRDSGISGCELEEQTGTSPCSRVRFTIGDVPLKHVRNSRRTVGLHPTSDCTCGSNLKRVSPIRTSGIGNHLVLLENDNCVERDSGFDGEGDASEVVTLAPDPLPKVRLEHAINVGSCVEPDKLNKCKCPRVNGFVDCKNTDVKDESVKRRHKSEGSTVRNSTFLSPQEIAMPTFEGKQAFNCTAEYYRNFAWSLMANFTDHYMSDFTLQGTNDTDYLSRLCTDLCVSADKPVLDDPVAESVCILANIDNWSVQVISNKTCEMDTGTFASSPVSMSQLIANTTESVHHLWKLKMSPEFCLMHLEDRLQEIYFKSRLLAEYLTEKSTCDIEQMTSDLGLDASDLPLLMAVASTHSAPVTCMYGVSYR